MAMISSSQIWTDCLAKLYTILVLYSADQQDERLIEALGSKALPFQCISNYSHLDMTESLANPGRLLTQRTSPSPKRRRGAGLAWKASKANATSASGAMTVSPHHFDSRTAHMAQAPHTLGTTRQITLDVRLPLPCGLTCLKPQSELSPHLTRLLESAVLTPDKAQRFAPGGLQPLP